MTCGTQSADKGKSRCARCAHKFVVWSVKSSRKRICNSLDVRLAERLRVRLYAAVKGGFKKGSAVRDLGCNISKFKDFISEKFQTGMSWDNHGGWHLDHILPLASFDLTDRKQFLAACHYTNYQPLWAKDNLKKGAKVG